MKTYDLIVIGGGSAGFNAAQTAAGLGQRVAVIDGGRPLGGLCILRGCMPSKTLIYSAEVLHRAQQGAKLGLRIPRASADLRAIHARKLRIIGEFAASRLEQLEHGKFDLIRSRARFLDDRTLALADGRTLRGRHCLIATGSQVSVPPVPGLREARAWTSDDVLDLDALPRSVIVLGGGIVACELAQFLRRVGSRVVLIQRSPALLRGHSPAAAAVVRRAFTDEGIEVFTDTTIEGIAAAPSGTTVRFRHRGRTVARRADRLLNALGREPATHGLDLAAAGVKLRPNGRIETNRWLQTSVPHIYAAGDCTGPHEIVHVAIQQGVLAARHAAGQRGLQPIDPGLLLSVVFTDPQVASIGRSEAELDAAGQPYLTASYPFDDHGRSILMEALYGYVKVIAEPKRGRILGAEIVGRDAGELIHCFSGPLAMRATVHDLLKAPWYHPTLAEIVTYPLETLAERLSPSPPAQAASRNRSASSTRPS
jgi:pyruvate/2-oxoglutarate dehydrogenase complex dihydrolipoamide dehydrogenase (E3) component